MASFCNKRLKIGAMLGALLCASMVLPEQVVAQMTTNAPALSASTFQRIDENGVDLISGRFNFVGPRLRAGAPPREADFPLRWNGYMWSFPSPTIWMDEDATVFIDTPQGVEEFEYKGNSVWSTARGNSSTISCIFYDQNVLQKCTYYGHDGSIGGFDAHSPYGPYFIPDFLLPNGNVTSYLNSWCDDKGFCTGSVIYDGGKQRIQFPGWVVKFYDLYSTQSTARLYSPANDNDGAEIDSISISTPSANESDRYDDSVLVPENATQVMTERDGSKWYFTFDSSNDLRRVRRPGSTTDDLIIDYDDGHRVTKLTNALGTWYYTYTTSNPKTTVTKPDGKSYSVTYIKKKGNIRSHTDEFTKITTYNYDTSNRLQEIIYPELNRVVYGYDSRGNIETITKYPKPNSSEQPVTVRAEYAASCSNRKNCNKPTAIIDALNNRTEYTYQDGYVLTETKPEPTTGAAQPQVRWKYAQIVGRELTSSGALYSVFGGLLPIEKSECLKTENCAGTSDEVRTVYDYGPTTGVNPAYLRGTAVIHNGQTRRTCFEYDARGNKIAETEPRADLASCGAGGGEPSPDPDPEPEPDPGTCSGVTFSVNNVSAVEGSNLSFTVTKAGTTSISCSVNYATADGSAISPGDYAATSGTLAFTSTQTSLPVNVATYSNVFIAPEPSETMYLNLSGPTDGGSISDNQGVGTIIDDGTADDCDPNCQ